MYVSPAKVAVVLRKGELSLTEYSTARNRKVVKFEGA